MSIKINNPESRIKNGETQTPKQKEATEEDKRKLPALRLGKNNLANSKYTADTKKTIENMRNRLT